MPTWQFDKKELRNSPSFRDGIDRATEQRYRKECARFIIDVSADMKLNYDTVATACVYFHRFFMFHSFRDFNRYIAALGCLFLAGKVEETPKKCRDLIRAARQRLTDEQFSALNDESREEIMTFERILLQTIKFDLQIDHPYKYLLRYAKILKGDQEKIQHMVQMAWTFINDSLCTMLCLQWEPEIIAIAVMYLASRLTKFNIEDWQGRIGGGRSDEKWWNQFVEDMSMELLEDICHQVLDLYSPAAKEKAQQQTGSVISGPSGQHVNKSSESIGAGNTAKPQLTPPPSTVGTPSVINVTGKMAAPQRLPTAPTTPLSAQPPDVSQLSHQQQVYAVPPNAMSTTAGHPPGYAYPLTVIAPPIPPGASAPIAGYQPTRPVFAPYMSIQPSQSGNGAVRPPSYAVPTSFTTAPPPVPFTAPPPGTLPTYVAPGSLPHPYSIPPPPPSMNLPPPGYGAPPPPPAFHHQSHLPQRRI